MEILMKKVILALAGALPLVLVAPAGAVTLYEDPATGQVFTQPGDGRVEVEYLPDTKGAAQDAAPASAAAGEPVALDEDVQAAIDESVKEQVVKESPVLASYGDKGFRLETRDGKFQTNLQWRAQFRYSNPRDGDPRQIEDFYTENESSFEPRRLRMKIGGHGFQPWLKYYFEVDLQPARDPEADAQSSAARVITWRADIAKWKSASLRVGQWKIEQNRERVDSSGRQQFVERSIVNRVFTIDRQVGLQLKGKLFEETWADLNYWAGIYNGEGRGVQNEGDDHMYSGRVQWNFLKRDLKFRQSDVKFHEKPAGTFALSGTTNTGRCTRWSTSGCGNLDGFVSPRNPDARADQYGMQQYVQEFAFKYRGLSIQQEYHHKRIDDKGNAALGINAAEFDLDGLYLQTGYFFHGLWDAFPKKMELAARYAYVEEPNAGINGDDLANPDIDNKRQEYTAAVNYFFAGHRNKLTLDYSYLTLDNGLVAANENEDRVRIQWDVSF